MHSLFLWQTLDLKKQKYNNNQCIQNVKNLIKYMCENTQAKEFRDQRAMNADTRQQL